MNFYFSLSRLIGTTEQLEEDIRFLETRALRLSPRDSLANRDLLGECRRKVEEVKLLLHLKTRASRTYLRHTQMIYQILELSHRRLLHLTAAIPAAGPEDRKSIQTFWELLSMAHTHYQVLFGVLAELTGTAIVLDAKPEQGELPGMDFLQREVHYRQEIRKLLEKALELFDEEPKLVEVLAGIRKDLIEAGKRLKHSLPASVPAKVEQVAVGSV